MEEEEEEEDDTEEDDTEEEDVDADAAEESSLKLRNDEDTYADNEDESDDANTEASPAVPAASVEGGEAGEKVGEDCFPPSVCPRRLSCLRSLPPPSPLPGLSALSAVFPLIGSRHGTDCASTR